LTGCVVTVGSWVTFSVNGFSPVFVSELLSVTVTVNEAFPGVGGVPLMTPLLDRDSPFGSEPPVTE
jgi:hypothetical protein